MFNLLKLGAVLLSTSIQGSLFVPITKANKNLHGIKYTNSIKESIEVFGDVFTDCDFKSYLTDWINNENYLEEFPANVPEADHEYTIEEVEGGLYLYYLCANKVLDMGIKDKSVDELRAFADHFMNNKGCIIDILDGVANNVLSSINEINDLFSNFNVDLIDNIFDRDGFTTDSFYQSIKQDFLSNINIVNNNQDISIDSYQSLINLNKTILELNDCSTDAITTYVNEWLNDEELKQNGTFNHLYVNDNSFFDDLNEEQLDCVYEYSHFIEEENWETKTVLEKAESLKEQYDNEYSYLTGFATLFDNSISDRIFVYSINEIKTILSGLFIYEKHNLDSFRTFLYEMGSIFYKIADSFDAVKEKDYPNFFVLLNEVLEDTHYLADRVMQNISHIPGEETTELAYSRYHADIEIFSLNNKLWNEDTYNEAQLKNNKMYTSLLEGLDNEASIELVVLIAKQASAVQNIPEPITPQLRINGTSGEWEVSYDGGLTWSSLGVIAKGDKGETGPQGDKGDKGDTGSQGETGTPGQQGATGPQGEAGPQGPTGEKGADGNSSTAITISIVSGVIALGCLTVMVINTLKRKKNI